MPDFEASSAVPLKIWTELLIGVEMVYLRASPVFYGFGIPPGDGSPVIVIPGFLGSDLYLADLYGWLRRIGYKPYYSNIGVNAECPNIIVTQYLNETIDKARRETSAKVHLVGHSLGGILALGAASLRPELIASVTTLGSPIRGSACHPVVLRASEMVRDRVLETNGHTVMKNCFTSECTCEFFESLRGDFPKGVAFTAIYTKSDGIVDWQHCITGDPEIDCEVPGTHGGLVFNPAVYALIATRLQSLAVKK